MIWRDAAGTIVQNEGRYKLEGTNLVITGANWADMGRYSMELNYSISLYYLIIIFLGLPAQHRMDLVLTWSPASFILLHHPLLSFEKVMIMNNIC